MGWLLLYTENDYVAAGMDNEVFRSWGPEDIERVKRFEILGYKIRRIPGPLFHLDHERNESGYTSIAAVLMKPPPECP